MDPFLEHIRWLVFKGLVRCKICCGFLIPVDRREFSPIQDDRAERNSRPSCDHSDFVYQADFSDFSNRFLMLALHNVDKQDGE